MQSNARVPESGTGPRLFRLLALTALVVLSSTANSALAQPCSMTYSLSIPGNYDWMSAPWNPAGIPGTGPADCATLSPGVQVQLAAPLPNPLAGLTIPTGATVMITPGVLLTVSGTLSLTGGTVNNDGTILFPSPGSFNFSGGFLGGMGTTELQSSSVSIFDGSVAAMNILQPLNISGGEVDFNSPTNTLNINSSGALMLNGGLFKVMAGGIILGTGPIAIGSGAQLSSTASPPLTISNPVNNGGSIATQMGLVSLTGGGTHTGQFSAMSTGSAIAFSGAHTFNTGASFSNANPFGVVFTFTGAGSQFTLNTPLSIPAFGWTGGTIQGSGAQTLTVTGPNNQIDSSAGNPLTLAASTTVRVSTTTGALSLMNTAAVHGTGTIQIDGGADLNVNGGNNELAPYLFVNGGNVYFTAGAGLTLAGGGKFTSGANVSIGAMSVLTSTGGLLEIADLISLSASSGVFRINGAGAVSITGATSVFAPTLEIDSGSLTSSLSPLVINTLVWNGGTIGGSGAVQVGSTTMPSPVGPIVIDGTQFVNEGSFQFEPTFGMQLANGASFNNLGTFQFVGDGTISGCSGCAFWNQGGTVMRVATLGPASRRARVSSATGSSTFTVPVFVLGSVDAHAGAGSIDFAAGGSLDSSGSLTTNSATDSVRFTGGTFSLHSGSLGGPGPFVVMPAATLAIDNSTGGLAFNTATLVNNGAALYSSASPVSFDGSSITNSGTFSVMSDGALSASLAAAAFANSGTLEKTGGTLTSFAPAYTTSGTTAARTGTIDFLNGYNQTAGTTTLGNGGPGTISLLGGSGTLALNGGALNGVGTIKGALANSGGIVAPGSPTVAGTIGVTGTYNQGASAGLQSNIGGSAAGQFGVLNVSGSATLAGTLYTGFISPYTSTSANGSTFQVMTFGTKSGDFTTYSMAPNFKAKYLPTPTTPTSLALVAASADLAVTQTVSPSTILNGQTATITVTVTNNGPQTATNIVLTDTMSGPAIPTATSPTATCTISSLVMNCSIPSLAASASAVVTISVPANAAGTFTSAPSVPVSTTATPPLGEYDPVTANNAAAAATITVNPASDLAVTLSGPGTVNAGQNATFTVTINNAGPDAATSAPVALSVSGGSVVSATGATCTTTATTATCTIASIAATGTTTITLVAQAGTGSPLTINANSTYSGDPNSTNDNASATATINPSCDIAVTKSGPASVLNGQNAVFTMTVKNLGPSVASNVTLTDSFTGASFVSVAATAGASCTSLPVNCSIASLAVGATETITLTLKATAPGTLSNTASGSSTAFDADTTNNAATANVTVSPASDIAPSVTPPASVNGGQNGTFTITAANSGPDAATSVPLSLSVSGGNVVSASGATCTTATTTASCTIASIAASGTATITLVATAGTATPIAVTATSSYAGDPNSANDVATASATVNPSAEIAVTSAGPTLVGNGQNVTLTLTVTNNGPSTATAVSLTNTFTGGAFVSATSPAATCSGTGPVNCAIGTLAAGANAVVTLTLTATGTGTLTNTAVGTASEFDANSANNTATATLTIQPLADLALTITDSPDPVNAGTPTTYTATITNAGPDSMSMNEPAQFTVSGGTLTATGGALTCTLSASTALCDVSILAAGASTTVTLTATAGAGASMSVSGLLHAWTTTPPPHTGDPNVANDQSTQATTIAPSSDIAVTQTASPAAVNSSQNAVFTIVVTNNGPSAATGVSVSDSFTGATFASVSATPGTTCSGSSPVSCSIASLAVGASETITLTLTAAASGSIASTATVASPAFDPNAGNNTASASIVIAPTADLLVVSTAAPSPVNAAHDTTITVTVKNLGPATATNVVLTDSLSGGTLVQALPSQGSCTTSPSLSCSLGTLASTTTATVTIVLHAGTGVNLQNSATASATEADPDPTNNAASVTIPITAQSDISVTKTGPSSAAPGKDIVYEIKIANAGPSTASGISVTDVTPSGLTVKSIDGACTSFPCTIASLALNTEAKITATYTVSSGTGAPSSVTNSASVSVKGDPNNSNNSASVTTSIACATLPPSPVKPNGTTVVASPVDFEWTFDGNAISYEVFINQGGTTKSAGTTSDTRLTASVASGAFSWYVIAKTSDCGDLQSNSVTVNACNRPVAPLASVVANAASGQTYAVQWDGVTGAGSYEIDEASDIGFTDAKTKRVDASPVSFTNSVPNGSSAKAYFYRVRAVAACDANVKGPYSQTIRAVIAPLSVEFRNANANVPTGSTRVVLQEVHIPGIDDGNTYNFSATVDKSWMSVTPPNGILPPLGINLQVSADPTSLTNGTYTGTVIVTITPASSSNARTAGSTTVSVPVSVSLVTPVMPTTPTTTPANALVIPSVGHLDGVNSQWQSDVRFANTGYSKQQVQLTFTPASNESTIATTGVKQTTITIDAGQTVALDDVARNWFGVGSLGEAANGVLVARPLSSASAKDTSSPSVSTVIASSRTYSVSSAGTSGQYIPAIPFSSFIGAAAQGQLPAVLTLQQIAQSNAYRTNLGIVEAAGAPAAMTLSVFNCEGKNIKDIPLTISAFQQLQLNSFLASQGIALNDGRIQLQVTSGTGKVTAYASVVDNVTNDPLLVSGVPLSALAANHYVLPGVADLSNGLTNWRSDVRIFNGGTTPHEATFTLYRLDGEAPLTATAMLNPGEVKTLDSAVQSLFGKTNTGGALHVTTESNSSLVVSGRTYNACSDGGTYGQFIQAVTSGDGIGLGGRTLNILQVEDSPRYRTNIGIAEVSGQAATAQVTVVLPDSKVAPKIEIPLAANEYRQFAIVQQMGLGNVYNARVSVSVVGGNGKITAYGSIIDQNTQDPTFVPAQ